MPLTAAEKQRLYRERLKLKDPEKYDAMKKKNAERTKSKKKRISDCTEEEKQVKREKWVAEKKKKRPIENVESDEKVENKRRVKVTYQRIYRINIKLQKTIELQKKHMKKIQKQLNRYREKCEYLTKTITALEVQQNQSKKPNLFELTPRTKTDVYVQENFPNIPDSEKQKVKKQVFEHNVLVQSLRHNYNNSSNNEKDVLKNIVVNDVVNKYKLKSKMASYLGLKGRIRRYHDSRRKRRAGLLKKLIDFYERDDVSRATAGKKEVKTHNKEKRQRRYLLHPMKHLYKVYRSENGTLAFSSFKRHRPFYILPPKLSNRETCACAKHDNMEMKITKLNSLGLTVIRHSVDLLAETMCDVKSKNCAYNDCVTCKNKMIELKNVNNMNDIVSWHEWTLESLEYTNKESKKIKTKRMIKKEITGSLDVLIKKINDELIIFKKHCYNISHQYRMYRKCLDTLDDNAVLVHIDFSENYGCKLSTEVQAMHFGASKVQVSLHTGLLYHAKENEPISFCTISPCTYHGPEAIWAHLEPILKLIKQDFPAVTAIHFFSDGPTSQYRQKKNFHLFEQITKTLGFPGSTWNFFEAAHGKGAADGIGGAIKRNLDAKVAYGKSIPDAETAFKELSQYDTKIKVFYIPETAIYPETSTETKSLELTPIPGTINLHQIRNTTMQNTIAYRDLSCFCDSNSPKGYCQCLNVKTHNLMGKQTACKRGPTDSESSKEKKRQKIMKKSLVNESYCESDFSVHDTSDDETYEQWKDSVEQTDLNRNVTKDASAQLSLKPVTRTVGSYVIFKYDEKLYPGIIESICEEGALISAMKKSLKSWKWPKTKDELLYSWGDILGSIEPPKLVSKRGLFSIPELNYLDA